MVCTHMQHMCSLMGNRVYAMRTQCKVFVRNHLNPSLSPFAGVLMLLMNPGYDASKLLSIFTFFHLFVPIFTLP